MVIGLETKKVPEEAKKHPKSLLKFQKRQKII